MGAYKVFYDENAHYMDPSERGFYGEYETREAALAAARSIVNEDLAELHAKGMSAQQLFKFYTFWGRDPFIVPPEGVEEFSGWDYARQRCREICAATRNDEG